MSEAVTVEQFLKATPEDAEIQAQIRALFARLDEMDIHIERNQAETDRLKAETRVMLASLVGANGRSE